MDLKDILSAPSQQNNPPRSVTSAPNTPAPVPLKYVQRTQSGSVQTTASKSGLGASPLSQTVMNQTSIPAHVLSPVQKPVSSPLISPVPALNASQSSRPPSTASMDALADLASMQNHQPVRPTQTLLRGRQSYESQQSVGYSSTLSQSLTSNPRASFDINMMETPKQVVRTDFSGTSLPQERQARLTELVTYIQDTPSAYDAHVEIINILHDGFINHIYPSQTPGARGNPRTYSLLPDLRNARQQMERLFAVGEKLWSDWLQDESMLAQTAEERIAVVERCRQAVEEEVGSVPLWTTYGDWVHHCYNWAHDESRTDDEQVEERMVGRELFTKELVVEIWREAVNHTRHNLAQSHQTWNKYLEVCMPQQKPTPDQIENGKMLFQDRLQTPHIRWDETFQAFSSFVSAHFESDYEQIMSSMARSASDAKQKMAARESFEAAIEQAQASRDRDAEYMAFTRYVDWERTPEKRRKPNFTMIDALFQRAELSFPTDATIWEEHANFLLTEKAPALTLLERAAKHCPWSGSLWSQYLLTSDRMGQSFQETENIKHTATNTGVLEAGGIEEIIKVHAAWCSYLRRRSSRPDGSEEDIDVAEMGIRSSIENVSSLGAKLGIGEAPDSSFRLHRIYINFLTESARWDNARHEFDTLVRDYGKSYEFWQRFYQWEMMRWRRFASSQNESGNGSMGNVAPPHLATGVLKKALEQTDLDFPEPIMQTFVTHCEDYEDADELQQALLRVNRMQRAINARRQAEAAQLAAEPETQSGIIQNSKRKREDDGSAELENSKKSKNEEAAELSVEEAPIELPKRDRENATILVENLPDDVSETRIRQYFSSCGLVKSLKVLRDDGVSAIIEFEDDDAAKYALSRDEQDFDGAILSVQLDSGSTLYVTNYNASADETYIQNLLTKYGEIIGIRFPSLQGNKKRRFCYVQFKTPSEAQSATALDGQTIDDLPIVCKISNPAVKKSREDKTNVNDGRTVFIGQLNFRLTEQELEKAFAEYGKIILTRMPRNETMKNRNKGIAFITYDTEDAAKRALAMDGQELKERKIVVKIATNDNRRDSVARTTASPAPAVNGRDDSSASLPHRSDLQDRQVFLTNVPDTVNESRIRSAGEKHGKVLRVILKTNHQGAILEYATVAEAGEASLRLDGHEIDPDRPLRVVSEKEMQSMGREKKTESVAGAKSKPAPKPAPIGMIAPVKRPTQPGARRGGHLGQRSAALFHGRPKPDGESGTETNGTVLKRSNDDFKAMFKKD